MATVGLKPRGGSAREERFFLNIAIAIALIIVAGFSTQLAAGRSTFHSPLLVHAHAIVFMGWMTLFLTQNILVATGQQARHRQLGWIATGWMAAMVVLGCWVTVAMVRRGQVPFFFRPTNFLVFDPLSLLAFVGLSGAAIVMRRRTDWHRRLHVSGMALLLGPAFGRLLPMPLLAPYAFEATFLAVALFLLIVIALDSRRRGSVHPAWQWGLGTIVATVALVEVLTFSPAGATIYRAVTNGSPGAEVDGMAFPPPPAGPLVTGRS